MHHGQTIDKNQYGDRIALSVLSTKDDEGTPGQRAEVDLQIYVGSMLVSFDLTPTAARDPAVRLMAAATAAEAPAPVQLYREPEAA